MFSKLEVIQPVISNFLLKKIDENSLSGSLLFYGDEYTGRLTASLECASALLKSDIYKNFKNIYLSLSRSLVIDVRAKGNLYIKNLNNASFSAFLHSLFIFVLSRNFSSIRDTKASLDEKSDEELILIFNKLVDIKNAYDNSDDVVKIVKRVLSIVDKTKSEQIFGINDVRLLKKELSTNNAGSDKQICIIEGLENSTVGAKNAFLKLLEEPPKNTYFIIIATKDKNLLGETILSRLFPVAFKNVTMNAQNKIITSFGGMSKDYDSLSTFFLSYGFEESDSIKQNAVNFANLIFVQKNREETRKFVLSLTLKTSDSTVRAISLSKLFLLSLQKRIMEIFNSTQNIYEREKVMSLLNNAYSKLCVYNLSFRSVLLSLMDDFFNL